MIDDVIASIFWIGFVCCLPTLAITAPVAYVLWRQKQRSAGSEAVAAALGLTQTAKVKQMWWYQGDWEDGRRLALIPIIFPKWDYNSVSGQRQRKHDAGVCLVVELLLDAPLPLEVVRHINWTKKRPPDSFESAFNAENGEKLTPGMQQALLDFVQRHPGTLWLRRRAEMPLEIFEPPEVMAGASMILLHEYLAQNPAPDEVRAKTADLAAVARAIEKIG